jgi:TonB family protein
MLTAARSLTLAVSLFVAGGTFAAGPQSPAGSPPSSSAPQAADGGPPARHVEIAGRNGVTVPRPIGGIHPGYPAKAQRRGVEGTVTMECIVEVDGTVSSVRVLQSLDRLYGLDDAAVNAVKKARFEPARKDGVPVPASHVMFVFFSKSGLPVLTREEVLRAAERAGTPPKGEAAPYRWPDTLRPTGQAGAGVDWTKHIFEADGLSVTVTCPAAWTREEASRTNARSLRLSSADSTRVVLVTVGRAAREIQPFTAEELNGRLEMQRRTFKVIGSSAVGNGFGQVKVGDQLWEWLDYSAPAADKFVPPLLHWTDLALRRGRVWHFTTTQQGVLIDVTLGVAYDASTEQENARKEREAAADLASVLSSVSWIK